MPEQPDLRLAAVGVLAGSASGLLGVGGGIVLVPGLVLVARIAQRRAHATSLAAIVPIGLVGAVTYLARGDVHLALAGVLAAGSVIGAPVGVRALQRVPVSALRIIFVVVMVASALRLLLADGGGDAVPPAAIGWPEAAIAFGVGVGAGAFAGLLGVGGGIVMVPAMTVLLEQGQHVAQGTSLLAIIATAIAATLAGSKARLVDARAAIVLGAAGAAAAVVGALVASRLADATLKRVFAVFLLAIAVRLLVRRGDPPEPEDETAK